MRPTATPSKNFAEGGPIWGDVTTNGGNVTHLDYQISGDHRQQCAFTIPPLPAPNTTGFTLATRGPDRHRDRHERSSPTGSSIQELLAAKRYRMATPAAPPFRTPMQKSLSTATLPDRSPSKEA
jgi:hypothetical protein